MVSLASAAVAQPDSGGQRLVCTGAAATWAPVRLPAAGVSAAIPCNDQELNAYRNANDERKRADGIVGCERDGRTYIVMYLVNTPAGFFDQFNVRSDASPVNNFQVAGHRASRLASTKDGESSGNQLVEIDANRAVLMWSSSKIANDADFSKITSCFFNSFEFAPQ
jgi:hypothetical protein